MIKKILKNKITDKHIFNFIIAITLIGNLGLTYKYIITKDFPNLSMNIISFFLTLVFQKVMIKKYF